MRQCLNYSNFILAFIFVHWSRASYGNFVKVSMLCIITICIIMNCKSKSCKITDIV